MRVLTTQIKEVTQHLYGRKKKETKEGGRAGAVAHPWILPFLHNSVATDDPLRVASFPFLVPFWLFPFLLAFISQALCRF